MRFAAPPLVANSATEALYLFRCVSQLPRGPTSVRSPQHLAVGVVIGAAFDRIVKGLTDDVVMPLVSQLMPCGNWRSWGLKLPRGDARLLFGDLIGVTVDFVIVAAALFVIIKTINRVRRPAPPAEPATRECPACLERVPTKATRCRACTSALQPVI